MLKKPTIRTPTSKQRKQATPIDTERIPPLEDKKAPFSFDKRYEDAISELDLVIKKSKMHQDPLSNMKPVDLAANTDPDVIGDMMLSNGIESILQYQREELDILEEGLAVMRKVKSELLEE